MELLARNYKIKALTKEGDTLQISTEARDRAVGYLNHLSKGKYSKVWIELGSKEFLAENLKDLP